MHRSIKPSLVAAFFAASFISAGAYGATWKGYLVDRMCADSAKTPAKVKELCETHTKECALDTKCAQSGYTVYSGSRWYPFDDKGNKLAKTLIEKSKRDTGLPVQVSGTLKGNTIAVDSLKETAGP